VLRASVILGLVVANMATLTSVANAAPKAWTLPPLPADWKDVTAETMQEPAMAAQKEIILKAGGTFDATIYASDGGGAIIVITSVFAGASATMPEADAFMNGSRKRSVQNGREISWNLERTPTALVGTQQFENQGVAGTTKTYVGFLDNDDLRAIAFMCFGTGEVCAQLMANATIETAGMQLLSELDANNRKLTPRRVGYIAGVVAMVIFLLVTLWNHRPRAPK
jgi:hypothetical protein